MTPRLFAFPTRDGRLNLQACASAKLALPGHGEAGAERRYRRPVASNPKDPEVSADALEVFVTRGQGCLPGLGEGGEAAGVGKMVLSFEAGGQVGQFHVHVENPKLGDLWQFGRGRPRGAGGRK